MADHRAITVVSLALTAHLDAFKARSEGTMTGRQALMGRARASRPSTRQRRTQRQVRR